MLALLPVLAFLATGATAAPIQERNAGWFDDWFSSVFKWEVTTQTQTVNWDVQTQGWGTTISWGFGDPFGTQAATTTASTATSTKSAVTSSAASSVAPKSSSSAAAAAASSSSSSKAATSSSKAAASSSKAAASSSTKAVVVSSSTKAATSTTQAATSVKATPVSVTTTKASTSTTKASSSAAAASTGSLSSDAATLLKLHNDFRAQYGANALTWNPELATYAQNAANTCKYGHTHGPYGENIAAGVGGGYDVTSAFNSWANEACESQLTVQPTSQLTRSFLRLEQPRILRGHRSLHSGMHPQHEVAKTMLIPRSFGSPPLSSDVP